MIWECDYDGRKCFRELFIPLTRWSHSHEATDIHSIKNLCTLFGVKSFCFNQLMWRSPSVERELALFTSPADRIYRQLSLLTVCHKPGGNGAVVVKSTSFLFLKLFIKRHFFLETEIQFKGCAPQSLFGYSNIVNSRLLKNVNPNSLYTQFFSFNLKWEGKVFF